MSDVEVIDKMKDFKVELRRLKPGMCASCDSPTTKLTKSPYGHSVCERCNKLYQADIRAVERKKKIGCSKCGKKPLDVVYVGRTNKEGLCKKCHSKMIDEINKNNPNRYK